MTSNERPHGELDFVPLGKLTVFPITEHELDSLQRGAPDSIFLTFGIAALSVSITAFLSVIALTTESTIVSIVYWIVIVVGFLAGLVLLALWNHYRGHNGQILDTVRKRKNPEGEQIASLGLQPAKQESEDALLVLIQGVWRWQGCHTVSIDSGGRVISTSGESARCIKSDPINRFFMLEWSSGWLDELTLSEDGRTISGKNNTGNTVTAERK